MFTPSMIVELNTAYYVKDLHELFTLINRGVYENNVHQILLTSCQTCTQTITIHRKLHPLCNV
nr:MAG TPA: hypothetical protein [Caudoviricetes sp.]